MPEGGLGQLARVRVVEPQQVKSQGRINPLDFQQALGCLAKLHGSERRGKVVKALTPKARPFCDPRLGGSKTAPTERAEYVVPCSSESQFPYLWSTPLCSAFWTPIDGDPGAHEMSIPSRNGDPQEHHRDPPAPGKLGVPCPHAHFQDRAAGLATAAT